MKRCRSDVISSDKALVAKHKVVITKVLITKEKWDFIKARIASKRVKYKLLFSGLRS